MPEVRKQLKILCAETGRTQEDLLREALNDLFKKHEKPSVA
jgi:predicted DNA-binding protein